MQENKVCPEKIILESRKKEAAVEVAEQERNEKECEYMETVSNYLTMKKEVEGLKREKEILHDCIARKTFAIKANEIELDLYDEKIKELQRELEESKKNSALQVERFNETMKTLAENYKSFDEYFDEDNIKKTLDSVRCNHEVIRNQIVEDEERLRQLKSSLLNQKLYEIPDLKELQEAIREESIKTFGDPGGNEKKFSELTKQIEYLEEKIKEIDG